MSWWRAFRSALMQLVQRVRQIPAFWWGIGLLAVGGVILLPAAAVVLVHLAGFTAGGIAVGSLAAGIQSLSYGAFTTGAFSVLQSLGATAVPVAAGWIIVGIVAAGSGLYLLLRSEDRGDSHGAATKV